MGITGSAESVPKIHLLYIIMQAFILALLPLVAFADHAPAYGYGPQYHCRDTNTSVYAEVCVPAFTTKVTPIELAVKVVQDADYCYDQIVTVCTAADAIEQYELCTYSYAPLVSDLTGTVTQVTYADKSETMKVTSCKPSGYGDHYGAGEHQYCREEYQTQAYKVPLVTEPLDVALQLTNPDPSRPVSPRTSLSPLLPVKTKSTMFASMLLSLLMEPTLLINKKSSWVNLTATLSPSPCPPRPAKNPTTKEL